ncbi:MAG: hypothetical protein A2V64_09450 [Bacteroidetes bacterium RBG_13_43_22]|nr:MAG: hypothetical protein A2V64_09450 [Bacteroidetes bacterium RBG_13_43_22]
MKRRLKYSAIFLIILLYQLDPAESQILSDSTYLTIIRSGIDDIYSLRFNKAEEMYNEISRSYTGHPVAYLLHGLIMYWKNYPLLPASPEMIVFEEDMRKCFELCDKEPYSKQYEAEALLAGVSARGLLLVFYADNHMSRDVIPLASSTYRHIMKSFEFNSVYADLYYFTGIYNYYRDAYPKFHPVYKPVAVLFPPGNLETGLNELNICAQKSILLRAEASSILSWIYTNYENNYQTALKYTGSLTDLYPENLFFKALHIKNLLLLERYDEAEKQLELSKEESEHAYYCTQVNVFDGIVQEKKYKNINRAAGLYDKALNDLSAFGNYGNEFSAYCCFGLSRICDARGDKAGKRLYHRRAMNLASFKKISFD